LDVVGSWANQESCAASQDVKEKRPGHNTLAASLFIKILEWQHLFLSNDFEGRLEIGDGRWEMGEGVKFEGMAYLFGACNSVFGCTL
jgi:hypothetical protein